MPSGRRRKRKETPESSQFLSVTRVKAIAKQDESIGKITAEAAAVMARCADAFLVDLVNASAGRAKAACGREKRRLPYTRQVLPEDVQKAASDEERFDFLRPLLASAMQGTSSATGASSKAKRTRGGTVCRPQAGKQEKRPRNTEDDNTSKSGFQLGLKLPPTTASSAGERAELLALAGLDDEGRRAVLLGGTNTRASAASVLSDEEEDYDN